MAVFKVSDEFDFSKVNLNTLYKDAVLKEVRTNQTYGDDTYPTAYFIDTNSGQTLAACGTRIKLDAKGAVTGGTVNYLQLTDTEDAPYLTIKGISVSAKTVYAAAKTASTADDLKLLALALKGNDTITLSDFDDRMDGYAGNDRLYGADGNDTLFGGDGNDRLYGGAGNDRLTGGKGADRFIFDWDVMESSDRITDFKRGEDKIDLSAINATTSFDEDIRFIGTSAFTGVEGQLRFAKGLLQCDLDGDKQADFTITVSGLTSLKASDFIL